MQDCFRKYPEVYGAELTDEDEDGEGEGAPAPEEGAEAPIARTGEPKENEPAPAATTKSSPPDSKPAGKSASGTKKSKDITPDNSKADTSEPAALPNKGAATIVPDKVSP